MSKKERIRLVINCASSLERMKKKLKGKVFDVDGKKVAVVDIQKVKE